MMYVPPRDWDSAPQLPAAEAVRNRAERSLWAFSSCLILRMFRIVYSCLGSNGGGRAKLGGVVGLAERVGDVLGDWQRS